MEDDFNDAETLAALQAAERSYNLTPPLTASASHSSRPTATSTNPGAPKVQQPKPQALPQRTLPSAILVSPRQKGNPILNHISSLPWEYTDSPADYVLGQTTCALFLSLKYHRLHPEYIYARIRQLAGKYNLRVLLAMVDIDNHEEPLRELAKTSLVNNLTLILCWSAREAAKYLEAFKSLERADPSGIKGAKANTFAEQMQEFVTTPRGVNKADAVSLVSAFGSIRNAVNADREQVVAIPGWGEKKVDRFLGTVNEPFRVGRATRKVGRNRDGAGNEIRRVGMLKPGEVSSMGEHSGRGTPEGDAQVGRKRGRSEAEEGRRAMPAWEPGDDEEEALFMAETGGVQDVVAPADGVRKGAVGFGISAEKRKASEPQLAEGIEAALARLQKQ